MKSPGSNPTQNGPEPVDPHGSAASAAGSTGDEAAASADAGAERNQSSRSPLSTQVLERVRARDPEALGQLFEAYLDQVFGLSLRLLKQRAAAEDATQEIFLKIHRAADRIDPSRSPTPWILTIAHNVCRDVFRSASHKMGKSSVSIDETPDFGASLIPDHRTPEDIAIGSERDEIVREAIARLPDTLREVVVLHDYNGLGHQEIAEVVGASYAAVRKRYSRALSALAELLKDVLE